MAVRANTPRVPKNNKIMKADSTHKAYRIVVVVYFVWLAVYASLIGLALANSIGNAANPFLSRLFMQWMFFNLIMGTALFIVIRLFKRHTALTKVMFYSYYFVAAATLTTVLIIRNNG